MRLILCSLLIAFGLSTLPTTVFAQKIGVVDLQRAINETEDGRKAKARLKSLFKKRQDELDKSQQSIKTMKEEIERKKNVLSRDALQQKLEAYQQTFVALQSRYADYQRELAQKEGELTQKIIARMEQILRRIGQAQGYTLILERNEGGVVWVPSHKDLTDIVIQKYNAGEGRDSEPDSNSSKAKKSGKKK